MISNLPEGWREVKLEELCKDNSGMYGINESAVEYDLSLYRYLRITDIKDDGTIDENKRVSVNIKRDTESKYLLNQNDIVLARTGASAGRNYFYTGKEGPMIFAGFLIKFSLDESKVIPEYIKYHCQSREYNDWIKAISTGSTRPNINAKMYKDMKIDLPPIEQQELLVNTLSALDDKIELNNKINENLEKQAQAIFKHWFIDFEFPDERGNPYKSSGGEMVESELGMIPKGWEAKNINDLCEITSSKRIFREEYSEGGVPFFRGKEIIEKSKGKLISTELFITTERYNEIKSKFSVPQEKDILLTSVGTLGVAYQVRDEEFYFKDGNLTWFRNFKSEELKNYIYMFLISSIGKKELDKVTIGSTQKALTITALKNISILLPDNSILYKYDNIVSSILNIINNSILQNEKLSQLRDTLLPKLMSGEIRVPLD